MRNMESMSRGLLLLLEWKVESMTKKLGVLFTAALVALMLEFYLFWIVQLLPLMYLSFAVLSISSPFGIFISHWLKQPEPRDIALSVLQLSTLLHPWKLPPLSPLVATTQHTSPMLNTSQQPWHAGCLALFTLHSFSLKLHLLSCLQ